MDIKLFLVSGGFIPMAEFIAGRLKFADSHSNPLEVVDGQLSGEVNKTIINGDAKRLYVEAKCCPTLGQKIRLWLLVTGPMTLR